jgi:hypothetical protein
MNTKLNNVLTASRMNCFLRCQRQHFWQCEIGLIKEQVSFALKFGSAWARGMEARWHGNEFDEALALAIPADVDLDEYECAKVSALLAAYYDHYGPREQAGKMHPEQEFSFELGIGEFTVAGKLDAIGQMKNRQTAIIEGKTTGESIDAESAYWLRLLFNIQLCQYVIAARLSDWEIDKVFYDVTRKPSIKPKWVADLDENQKKIVVDADGTRIFNEKGKAKGEPRQSGDKERGWAVKEHLETPDEFCDRLYKDALARPVFYFARMEVAIVDTTLIAFEKQRAIIAKQILFLRQQENDGRGVSDKDQAGGSRDMECWPRNVSKDTCNYCSYKKFCLQNIPIDLEQLPEGFSIKPFNPELDHEDTSETDTTTAA